MSTTEIERRLAAVERQVSHLAEKLNASPMGSAGDMNSWIDQIHGTFKNDATYRKSSRLGRQWRKSQRATPHRADGLTNRRRNNTIHHPTSQRRKLTQGMDIGLNRVDNCLRDTTG
jgi:hypothetical protein